MTLLDWRLHSKKWEIWKTRSKKEVAGSYTACRVCVYTFVHLTGNLSREHKLAHESQCAHLGLLMAPSSFCFQEGIATNVLGRHQLMALVLRYLPPTRAIRLGLLTPEFGLAQPQLCWSFGRCWVCCHCLCFYFPAIQKNET